MLIYCKLGKWKLGSIVNSYTNSILKEFDSQPQMLVRMISSFGFGNEGEKNFFGTECDNLVGQ